MIRLVNQSRPDAPVLTVAWCERFLCRLRGLTFRKSLPPDWGLLLVQRRENRRDAAIHMLWMRMNLAIIWIDAAGIVVDVRPAYRWRSFLTPARPAKFVLETSLLHLEHFKIGDEIHFEEFIAA